MREFKNIFILFGLLIASCFFVMPIKADTNIRLEAQENEMEMKFPNSNDIYVGTAWMYGKRVAVTAGHCV